MLNEKIPNNLKKKVENDLKNYPFWLIALESSGLGYPTRWGGEATTSKNNSSFLEESVLKDLEKERKVNTITTVLTKLDNVSKELVEKWYFRDSYSRAEILKVLKMSKNKFYLYRDRALKKFMIALKYI
ncbi:nitroreductase [Clostridium phage CWou-2020a]|uniref:Nitroreductase n=1 Tax=Clostridium botulinum C/D str. DC5 TaxID=1443128 RepID=A0A0A0IJS0_CLOBO|nr:nitroreductase [Clostridium botulinum]QPW59428.1 nitroreductase [Clostridium phage CWou-2020a]KGN00839.1 nitroreductase [Clostridium botulinum C/D str. DC5]KOC54178.1 nitroreductase [Clostridium botulinum]KOC56522.1 nitroreductase [Clostridium botulinum]MCD3240906.1 nitroreductase [Clostridium botulinum D/C]